MLNKITLKNYKAFDEVSIPIKPLTILLGANSVGKSSITQMLMLLHQTAEERGYLYSSALKIYGKYVNVGAFENLYKKKITDKPLELDLVFSSERLTKQIHSLREEFVDEFRTLCGYFPLKNLWDLRQAKVNTKKDFTDFIKIFFELINKRGADNYKPQMEYFLLHRLGIPRSEIKKQTHSNILHTYSLLSYLEKELTNDDFRIEYIISLNKEKTKLYIDYVSFYVNEKIKILSYKKNPEDSEIESNIVPLDLEDERIIKLFMNNNKTIFDCVSYMADDDSNTSAMTYAMSRILRMIINEVTESLSEYRINYVSPLRAHPKRYYMLDKAKTTISLDTLDGDAIAEVLKENNDLKKRVNSWFKKFGFEIDVKGFKEVIHHVNVTQNNLSLDITDVGFGISQVLPIIIQGFLSMDDSITIIEQPEIHLHPMMQADLGDLFIDIINSSNKKLIIETHSEYLLKRIRRRISEGKKISPDMVSICLFHPKTDKKDAWVEVLEIGDKGSFVWPEEFYGGELYNDTVEFLKNQG